MFRRLWPFYLGWIALCTTLFIVFGGAEDPARPEGRILSIDAGYRAQEIARAQGLRGYEVVHVARARAGEGGREDRWVVLLDRVKHTELKEAVVIELNAATGTPIKIRKCPVP